MNYRMNSPNWQERWRRVSKDNPCLVCGKPDWCLVARNGSASICPRTPAGAVRKCGDAGWLHRHRDRDDRRWQRTRRITVRLDVPTPQRPQMVGLVEQFQAAVDPAQLDRLARNLGLAAPSLRRLGIGWSEGSHAW